MLVYESTVPLDGRCWHTLVTCCPSVTEVLRVSELCFPRLEKTLRTSSHQPDLQGLVAMLCPSVPDVKERVVKLLVHPNSQKGVSITAPADIHYLGPSLAVVLRQPHTTMAALHNAGSHEA